MPHQGYEEEVLTESEFLQGSTLGFGVEEVDDGDEAGVGAGEEEVGSPSDGGDHNRDDHDDKEVETVAANCQFHYACKKEKWELTPSLSWLRWRLPSFSFGVG